MYIQLSTYDSTLRISLSSESPATIQTRGLEPLKQFLDVSTPFTCIEIDLTGHGYLNSDFLSFLIRLRQIIQEHTNLTPSLIQVGSNAHKTLSSMYFDRLFSIFQE